MGTIAPLRRFPLFTSSNIEEAEVAICKSISDVRIQHVHSPARFNMQMNGIEIGRTSVVYNLFGSRTKLKAGLPENFIYFILSGEKPTSFQLGKNRVTISSEKAAVIMPERLTYIERSDQSEVLAVRLPRSDLMQHLEELTGRHHSGSLSFESTVDLNSAAGAMVSRMLDYILHELDTDDLLLSHPGYIRSFDQMLLSAILSLPHNKSAQLRAKKGNTTAPGTVRRAEEYMKAHLHEEITITDLLQISDCSRSALFSSFQNTRGYTPMEFLTEQRLQHARENLLTPLESDTVSSIATRSGFVNLGRFAKSYSFRFGERPSATLRDSNRK